MVEYNSTDELFTTQNQMWRSTCGCEKGTRSMDSSGTALSFPHVGSPHVSILQGPSFSQMLTALVSLEGVPDFLRVSDAALTLFWTLQHSDSQSLQQLPEPCWTIRFLFVFRIGCGWFCIFLYDEADNIHTYSDELLYYLHFFVLIIWISKYFIILFYILEVYFY